MNSQITASRAVQHCAAMNHSAEAARRAKQARAARPAAVKADQVQRAPRVLGWSVAARKRHAVPVVARPRTV